MAPEGRDPLTISHLLRSIGIHMAHIILFRVIYGVHQMQADTELLPRET
jgi:hypothetical protein